MIQTNVITPTTSRLEAVLPTTRMVGMNGTITTVVLALWRDLPLTLPEPEPVRVSNLITLTNLNANQQRGQRATLGRPCSPHAVVARIGQ